MFASTINYFIEERGTKSNDFVTVIREKFLVMFLLLGFCLGFVLSISETMRFGFYSWVTVSNSVFLVTFLFNLMLVKWGASLKLPTFLMIFVLQFAIGVMSFYQPGFSTPSYSWLAFCPLVATLICGSGFALFILLMNIVFVSLAFLVQLIWGASILSGDPNFYFNFFIVIGQIVFGGVFAYTFDNIINLSSEKLVKIQQDLLVEKQRVFNAQKLASLGEMAGGIAHEINNPMAILDGQLHMLNRRLKDSDDESLIKILAKMQNSVLRVVKIINGLKTLSRDGSLDDKELIEPGEFVGEVLGLCNEKLKKSRVIAESSLDHQQAKIYGQKVSLSQVLLNLLNNAIDALSDVEEKKLQIYTGASEDFVWIGVRDFGPGVPEEFHEKIMDPFFTTKPMAKGTGLGLSISNSIVSKHDGKLELLSVANPTDFRMSFSRQVSGDPNEIG